MGGQGAIVLQKWQIGIVIVLAVLIKGADEFILPALDFTVQGFI